MISMLNLPSRLGAALVCAAAVLLIHPAVAAPPPEQAWQAHWIGPATSGPPAIDLAGASWIWADEPDVDATRNAPEGPRFFRREITLPAGGRIMGAAALLAADNHFTLTVNGFEAGRGDDWQRPTLIDLASLLRPGVNRITLRVDNDASAGEINAAGLIGRIRVEMSGGPTVDVVTDATWHAHADSARPGAWPAVKVLGPAGQAPWTAQHAPGSERPSNLWTCYRAAFELAAAPKSAPARIAVDSKYWLWVNGALVVREGGLKRGPNPRDTWYDVVDLAPHLVASRNQIAVLAWYWGVDGFSHKSSGQAGLLFEMDAGGTRVVSDNTWKTLRHPAFGTASTTPNFRLSERPVRFDARLDLPDWSAPDFDDSAWPAANDHGAPPTAPWNTLHERDIPQWKDYGLQDYENAAGLPGEGGGTPVSARLPYNAHVTPWLHVNAPAGVMIKVGMDNPLNEITAEYITREGDQVFETPAWMNGHHVLYHIPAGVKILGLKYRESGYDTEFSGRFTCDQEFFNRLWVKSQRTLYVTMRDTFMDCPDRERAAWWGDIVIELGEVFYSLSPSAHSLIRKCMLDLCGWQRPSKTLFSPIPAGNWDKELPQQMLASVGKYGFWTYYLNTGDRDTLLAVLPHVRDYLSIWQTDADGLIVHRAGENGWDWADWGENVDIRVLDNAWFCLALEGAANMADVAGLPDEAAAVRARRAALADAFNAKFWNGSSYRDPGYNGATDDRANGLAVVAGLVPPDRFPAVRAVLAKERHASPYMEKYVLEALFLMGDATAALERMELRYRDIVASPLTTLPELFGPGGTDNHAWSGGPLTLLSQYVAGVAPTSAGFATFTVRPQLGGLTRAHAGFDTVKGRIEAAVAKEAGVLRIKVQVPPGTIATVCVPVAEHALKAVRAQGREVWPAAADDVSGLSLADGPAGHACVNVGPGVWEFEGR